MPKQNPLKNMIVGLGRKRGSDGLRVIIGVCACLYGAAPTLVWAGDVAKDVILSTLPPATTEFEQMGRQRLSDLIDRIAQIPDEEIPEFPVATNEYKVRMGRQILESASYCDQMRINFAARGSEVMAAEATNSFMVTVAEGNALTGVDPLSEEIVPTQEMILAHRMIAKMFGCI